MHAGGSSKNSMGLNELGGVFPTCERGIDTFSSKSWRHLK